MENVFTGPKDLYSSLVTLKVHFAYEHLELLFNLQILIHLVGNWN